MSEDECVLDRLLALSERPQDNVAVLRTAAARLHSRASSHDKNARSKIIEKISRKNSGYIALLLSLLETVKDHATVCSLVGVLHESCTPKAAAGSENGVRRTGVGCGSGAGRASAVEQLVTLGGTHTVLRLLLQLVRDAGPQTQTNPARPDPFTHDLLWLLAHLAQRDARFPLKCRSLGAVRPLHGLLRTLGSSSKLLYPLLMLTKVLARNASTAGLLVKDGAAQTMETTLASLGLTPHPRLRLCIDVLHALAKNRVFCARLSRTPAIHLLLRLLERCDHQEGKLQLRICASSLSTLHRLCTSKPGRMVLRSHNGLQLLQTFCSACPEERNRDALVARACEVIALCIENRTVLLPDGSASPARFPLPTPANNLYIQAFIEQEPYKPKNPCAGERSGSSSRETSPGSDDDRGEDDDVVAEDETQDDQCRGDPSLPPQLPLRDLDELQTYSTFYEELLRTPWSSRESSLSDSEDEDSVKSMKSLTISEPNIFISPSDILKNIKMFSRIRPDTDPLRAYCLIASKVNSVVPFVKVAYPDMVGAQSVNIPEPLNVKERRVCRSKLLQCIDRGLHPDQGMRRIVYDLDSLIEAKRGTHSSTRPLNNWDENRLGQEQPDFPHLLFESRFESGNLRRAIQVGPREYDLLLMPDVNSSRHLQWFYFEVSNMKAGIPYVFNIVNCEKQNSQFNYGMKPLLFSVYAAVHEQVGWMREGTDICYYRNTYQNPGAKNRPFLTTTFTINFPHAKDVCYLAYHFPYTYSRMMTQLWNWAQIMQTNQIEFHAQNLCYSLNDNEVPILTITAPDTRDTCPMQDRQVVILTARVHPGESNASWVMEGALQFLLGTSERAVKLREAFVFKVIPMLNPEGVINGCHRCGLTDEDLNRRWSRPDPRLHPVIYHAKGVIEYCVRVLRRQPFLFCDLHGHSRRKNVFLYGCSRAASWSAADMAIPEDPSDYLLLPHVLQQTAPSFALPLCCFRVERGREATARVALWRQLGITRSYTLESSYCGCDQGTYQDLHLGTAHLQEMGRNLCEGLVVLHEDGWRLRLLIACNPPAVSDQATRMAGLTGLGGLRTEDEEALLTEPSDSSDYDEEYHALNDCP